MKNRHLILLLFLLWQACAPAAQKEPAGNDESSALPNIVFILADDLGYGDVSANNPASKIQTNYIDQLAAEGMRFTDAHAPSSVCTPTRYGILTGRYCWRGKLPQGVLRGYGRALIEDGRTTVASLLKKKGYTTGVVGKWHLGVDWAIKAGHEDYLKAEDTNVNAAGLVSEMNPEHIDFTQKPSNGPLNHGFDYSFILPASLDMDPYCFLENDALVEIPSAHTPGNDLNTGYTEAFWRAGKIAPGFKIEQVLPTFKEKAISFIEQQAATAEPFFLYMPLAAPHTPWVPTDEFKGTANAGNYGDFVKMVDQAIGAVLQTLEEKGLKENTLVIFTSDNGPYWTPALVEKYGHKSAGPWRGMKADAWDGGHRIPYIARWPGNIKAGSTSDAITTLTHLMATVADIVGIELQPNEGEDSYSILPVLLGKADTIAGQKAILHHSSRNFYAIRQGDWKFIEGRGSGGFSQPSVYEPKEGEVPGQLYNMKEDMGETNNLYEQYPDKVEALQRLLDEMKKGG